MKTSELLFAPGDHAPLRIIAAILFPVFLSLSTLPAQTVYWDFTNNSTAGRSTDNSVIPGNAFTGPGVATSGFPDEACSNGEAWSVRGWYNTSSVFDARAAGDYVAFPVTVNASQSRNFRITGISFNANRSINTAGDERGPRTFVVYGSHNGYASLLFSGRNQTGETGTSASCGFHSDAADILVRRGETVTFRIYAYGDVATEISTLRIDNFTLDGTMLPIELGDFTARGEGGKVLLNWETYNEEDNDYMAVEHSANGQGFQEIGRVQGAGTTAEKQQYRFTDHDPLPGINFYRLRQVDFDGTTTHHRVVSVRIRSAEGPIRFFPTLAANFLSVRFPAPPEREGRLHIFDALGRPVRQVEVPAGALQQQFDISELNRGTYVLQYRSGRTAKLMGRFVKQ